MNLFRRVGRFFARKSAATFDWITESPSWRILSGGAKADVTLPYRQSPWVYAAARAKSKLLAGMPFQIKTGNRKDAQSAYVMPSTDPLVKLFENPSPLMDGGEFIEAMSIYLDLCGEWIAVLIGSDGKPARARTIPAEMILVHPKLAHHHVDPVTKLIDRWDITDQKATEVLASVPAESVVHHRLFNPDDPYRGLSPLEAARQGIAIDYKADAYTLGLIDNDATPAGALAYDEELLDDQREVIRKSWDEKMGGARNKGKIAIFDKGMSWVAIAQTSKEMQLGEQRRVNKEEIKAAFGVTDYELGEFKDLNRASSQTAKEWLWDNTILPMKESIERVWYVQFFKLQAKGGQDLWGEFDTKRVEALLAKKLDRVDLATKYIDLGVPLPVANDMLDLGIPPEGLIAPAGMMPGGGVAVGDAAAMGQPGQGVSVGAQGGGGAGVTVGNNAGSAVEGKSVGGGSPIRGTPAGLSHSPAVGSASASWQATGAGPQGTLRTATARPASARKIATKPRGSRLVRSWERRSSAALGAALSKFYRSMRDETLARAGLSKDVTMATLTPAQVSLLLGSPARWQKMAERFLKSVMEGIARGALRNAEAILGGFDVVNISDPQWLVTAARRTGQLIRVATRWRSAIRDDIIKWFAEGDRTVTQLADMIQDRFGKVIASNGMVIARTETGMLGSQIRNEAFQAEGIEETEWSAANDDHTRDSHRAVDGERRKMGERFSNGLEYPLEPGGPPEEVINCRCAALPVA